MGYKWRSSKWFIIATISIALYAETFLYGFLVPFLGDMLLNRLHVPHSKIQGLTSAVLAIHGALAIIAGPIIGHFSDRSHNRKTPLLLSLGASIIGTCMVAVSRSVHFLFLGRAVQGIAGSAVWIIGFATVADTVSPNNMGSAMGLMMSFANSGTISGPAISGLLYESVGYWVLWSIPLLVLTIDLVARVLMVDNLSEALPSDRTLETDNVPLLYGSEENPSGIGGVWRILLCNGRVLTCLLITFSSMSVSTSLHATLPLYIHKQFGWGSSASGLLFAGFVIPGVLLGPFAGWVRDKYGARYPVVVGAILQALVLSLSGVAGGDRFSWSGAQNAGKVIYSVCLITIGILRPFVSGIAPAELTDTAKRIQENTSRTLGGEGGVSRVIAMMDVAASLGMMVGPIMGGFLKELVGYEGMSLTWSLTYALLAMFAMHFLESQESKEASSVEENADC
ncbi:hypothetical protein ACN38_g11818 [Penicillium nordicum]|uniref:Major facilitator superfamily (MFS) profile domain-containing protein n=1 Tax=Penicillium nordicum TaxID=229535 RepID=A0A0M9WAS3_9EURO|nr:hypothetical protein ACN38_g11818 [Penicillium nordicum]